MISLGFFLHHMSERYDRYEERNWHTLTLETYGYRSRPWPSVGQVPQISSPSGRSFLVFISL